MCRDADDTRSGGGWQRTAGLTDARQGKKGSSEGTVKGGCWDPRGRRTVQGREQQESRERPPVEKEQALGKGRRKPEQPWIVWM